MSESLEARPRAKRPEIITTTPEVLDAVCDVSFTQFPTIVDEGGAQATGFLNCTVADCYFRKGREITGNAEVGVAADPSAVAEAKVRARARIQLTTECLVWRLDPANVGQDRPNDRLPQALRRNIR